MKKYALIVAGGLGKRMDSNLPKQFISVAGLPILMHTLTRFYKYDHKLEIILVLPVSHFSTWTKLSLEYDFDVPHKLVSGGSTRFQSVKNGLNSIEGKGLVAVHDGVRPVINPKLIRNAFEIASESGSAVLSVPLKESIRRINAGGTIAEDRSNFMIIQTPQVFKVDELKEAYSVEFNASLTDDASVAENYGLKINLVDGDYQNIKITSSEDLLIAETLLNKTMSVN
ncbi:MAG: 2-C-methyl-D-erythritol 4-phosphate cytidylyltransferase [Bacteroidetes bacterium]|nr:2-C-methyl-D-erythritol 4-phosphate cytidylyltransferase [Bacteroidota bacterium]MDA1119098.1 2-C-methyl-D-erythritol 4-phosphate cytidylyltransferase [Bacteroidota bacterium]